MKKSSHQHISFFFFLVVLMALSVSRIFLYPVKECNPFEVDSWEITSTGTLLYDREWAVLGPDGEPLTQPNVPALCFVHPKIDLEKSTLTLEAKGMEPLTLTIAKGAEETIDETGNVTMCGKKLQTIPEPEENIKAASEWFTKYLGIKCSWARSRYLTSITYILVHLFVQQPKTHTHTQIVISVSFHFFLFL